MTRPDNQSIACKSIRCSMTSILSHYSVDTNEKLVKEGCGRVRSFRSWNEHNLPKVTDAWVDYIDNIIVPAEKPEQVAEELRRKVGAPRLAIVIKELEGGHILVPDAHERENQADRTYIIRHFVNAEYSETFTSMLIGH